MTTKFAALAVFFLCFMPASKIEHTEALFTFAKKPKQEPSTLVADLNKKARFRSSQKRIISTLSNR